MQDFLPMDVDLARSFAKLPTLDVVESVQRIQEPYKAANRKFHPDDTVLSCGGVKIGGGNFSVIAGPCSVESEEQIVGVAKAVKAAGATMLRGGAFKRKAHQANDGGRHVIYISLTSSSLLTSSIQATSSVTSTDCGAETCDEGG